MTEPASVSIESSQVDGSFRHPFAPFDRAEIPGVTGVEREHAFQRVPEVFGAHGIAGRITDPLAQGEPVREAIGRHLGEGGRQVGDEGSIRRLPQPS